ncbi:hypothetical protein [Oceanobacillus luteolus]|uniref:Uncharacterized protein n=1 Tax=Oceanobacillus luteolus TaxID=1274358 RepID=A0ABW4HWB3_9BACI
MEMKRFVRGRMGRKQFLSMTFWAWGLEPSLKQRIIDTNEPVKKRFFIIHPLSCQTTPSSVDTALFT